MRNPIKQIKTTCFMYTRCVYANSSCHHMCRESVLSPSTFYPQLRGISLFCDHAKAPTSFFVSNDLVKAMMGNGPTPTFLKEVPPDFKHCAKEDQR